MKQETLEEAAERNYKEAGVNAYFNNGFIRGAKWQQEQDKNKFSEENIKSLIKIRNYFGENDKTMFEHFAYSFLNEFIKQLKNK